MLRTLSYIYINPPSHTLSSWVFIFFTPPHSTSSSMAVSSPENPQPTKNKNQEEKMQFDPSAPPPFKVADIRAAIPAHCWVKNPWRSMSYVLRDILVISSLVAIAVLFKNSSWVWPVYWVAQGTMFWAIFVLGHDW